jgi:hypothetical protein
VENSVLCILFVARFLSLEQIIKFCSLTSCKLFVLCNDKRSGFFGGVRVFEIGSEM